MTHFPKNYSSRRYIGTFPSSYARVVIRVNFEILQTMINCGSNLSSRSVELKVPLGIENCRLGRLLRGVERAQLVLEETVVAVVRKVVRRPADKSDAEIFSISKSM